MDNYLLHTHHDPTQSHPNTLLPVLTATTLEGVAAAAAATVAVVVVQTGRWTIVAVDTEATAAGATILTVPEVVGATGRGTDICGGRVSVSMGGRGGKGDRNRWESVGNSVQFVGNRKGDVLCCARKGEGVCCVMLC